MTDDNAHGYAGGEQCNRDGCGGIIDLHPVENCSCHINPPCRACTAPRAFCPVCEWEDAEENDNTTGLLNLPYHEGRGFSFLRLMQIISA